MSRRIKEIRDTLEERGCPIEQSLKAAQIIAKYEKKSLAARIAAEIVINAWADIAHREGF